MVYSIIVRNVIQFFFQHLTFTSKTPIELNDLRKE